MKTREMRAMSDEELLNALEDQKEALFNLRFQQSAGQLEDTNAPHRARKLIARLKTVMRERELAAELTNKEGQNG